MDDTPNRGERGSVPVVRVRAKVSDVAKLAGVSSGTVSNYLNRPKTVAPATAIRISEAIALLDE